MKNNNVPIWNTQTAKNIGKAAALGRGAGATITTLNITEKEESFLVQNDLYYTHMPKNDPIEATLYSAKMGAESHDNCDIF